MFAAGACADQPLKGARLIPASLPPCLQREDRGSRCCSGVRRVIREKHLTFPEWRQASTWKALAAGIEPSVLFGFCRHHFLISDIAPRTRANLNSPPLWSTGRRPLFPDRLLQRRRLLENTAEGLLSAIEQRYGV